MSLLVVLEVLEVLLRGLVLLVMRVVMVMLMLILNSVVSGVDKMLFSADWRARNITPWFPPY